MQKIVLTVLTILIATPVIAASDNHGIALRPVVPVPVKSGTGDPSDRMGQLVGEFVNVPGGCFIANNKDTCVDSFRIGKYEVTQGQYKRIMGNNPSAFNRCGDNCPVEKVSWNDAQLFISRLNKLSGDRYRLPSEAEWEYACTSGGKEEVYCGDDNIDAVAWYFGNSGAKTHPVGQKQPNGLGIYDMSGNVWEYVQDWYDKSYPSSQRNPTGSLSGSTRVIRGGSWGNNPSSERSSNRDENCPDMPNYSIGFRLASPAVQ